MEKIKFYGNFSSMINTNVPKFLSFEMGTAREFM
jgi:hypothetical protein